MKISSGVCHCELEINENWTQCDCIYKICIKHKDIVQNNLINAILQDCQAITFMYGKNIDFNTLTDEQKQNMQNAITLAYSQNILYKDFGIE